MRIMLVTLTLIAATILGGCNSEPIVEPADIVFAGGAVFTSDPDQPNASAVAIRGERIVYVGNEAGSFHVRVSVQAHEQRPTPCSKHKARVAIREVPAEDGNGHPDAANEREHFE